jgi:hypothetical protein
MDEEAETCSCVYLCGWTDGRYDWVTGINLPDHTVEQHESSDTMLKRTDTMRGGYVAAGEGICIMNGERFCSGNLKGILGRSRREGNKMDSVRIT